jgi:hypothetical protein
VTRMCGRDKELSNNEAPSIRLRGVRGFEYCPKEKIGSGRKARQGANSVM